MEVLRTAIFQLMRRRKKSGFAPVEIVQQLYPQDWELFIPELYDTLLEMYHSDLVEILIDGHIAEPSMEFFTKMKIRTPSKLI